MEIEKRYYTIGEVAKKFEVSTSLIRFWESQFEIIKPRKNKNGVRQYTKEDLETVGTIYHLVKEKGYTLSGAQEILKKKSDVSDTVEMISSLEKVKEFLLELRAKFPNQASTNPSEK